MNPLKVQQSLFTSPNNANLSEFTATTSTTWLQAILENQESVTASKVAINLLTSIASNPLTHLDKSF